MSAPRSILTPPPQEGFNQAPESFQESVLSRRTLQEASETTPFQNQIDGLVSGFITQASDWKSLAAMTAGGLAYRWGKISVLKVGAIRESPLLARPLSIAFGLSSEVTAFEFTHRALLSVGAGPRARLQWEGTHGEVPLQNQSPNLWSWSGPGGWKEGLLTSFVTFGTLKGFGKLSQGQNPVLQHGFQDAGMVLGHQLVYRAGIGPKPEGSLADQFVHAEATNLQIGVGMALGHAMTGGRILGVERQLNLSLRFKDQEGDRAGPQFALGLTAFGRSPSKFMPHIFYAEKIGGETDHSQKKRRSNKDSVQSPSLTTTESLGGYPPGLKDLMALLREKVGSGPTDEMLVASLLKSLGKIESEMENKIIDDLIWDNLLSMTPVSHVQLGQRHLKHHLAISRIRKDFMKRVVRHTHWSYFLPQDVLDLSPAEVGFSAPTTFRLLNAGVRTVGQLADLITAYRGLDSHSKLKGTSLGEVRQFLTLRRIQPWMKKGSARDKLLNEARRLVSSFYGKPTLPRQPGIVGIPRQSPNSFLNGWLAGNEIQQSRFPLFKQYEQIKALLLGFGKKPQAVNRLIVDAVFEERGWDHETHTAGQRLLFAARVAMALEHGGAFPLLKREGEKRPQEKYRKIEILLVELGMDPMKIDTLIREAALEEAELYNRDGSPESQSIAQELEWVAAEFGNRRGPGIEMGGSPSFVLGSYLAPPPIEEIRLPVFKQKWREAMATLTPKELYVLSKRFGLEQGQELTLNQIAENMNYSQERVRQIEEEALEKLRGNVAFRYSYQGQNYKPISRPLNRSIRELHLLPRALYFLETGSWRVRTIKDLIQWTEADLEGIFGLSPSQVTIIRDVLSARYGLSLTKDEELTSKELRRRKVLRNPAQIIPSSDIKPTQRRAIKSFLEPEKTAETLSPPTITEETSKKFSHRVEEVIRAVPQIERNIYTLVLLSFARKVYDAPGAEHLRGLARDIVMKVDQISIPGFYRGIDGWPYFLMQKEALLELEQFPNERHWKKILRNSGSRKMLSNLFNEKWSEAFGLIDTSDNPRAGRAATFGDFYLKAERLTILAKFMGGKEILSGLKRSQE